MIEVRLGLDMLGRARFAYSPLAEVAGSIRHLLGGRLFSPVHLSWARAVQGAVREGDLAMLGAVCPPGPSLADVFFASAPNPGTTIEDQLPLVAHLTAEQLRAEVEMVWAGRQMPPAARRLLADGVAGGQQLAAAVRDYWQVAISPYWPRIRSVLDDDVTHRASRLTTGGLYDLLSELHPEVSVQDGTLLIDKPHHPDAVLVGVELVLVPSVFAWPCVIVSRSPGRLTLTYGARGVGRLWEETRDTQAREDALGALLGRSRAAILAYLGLPTSTTVLAEKLGQSPPSVSQHLSVLRRNGLVISRRSGREVLYRRTSLASSLVALTASTSDGPAPVTSSAPAGLLPSIRDSSQTMCLAE